MKKNIKLFGLLTILSSLFFTACYDAVFYEILQDVESEDATVSGTIQQISRYTLQDGSGTEYLLCNADGGLRYKLASNRSHGSWATYSHLPFSLHSYDYYGSSHNGEQIIQVLADKTNIYLLTCVYFDDNDEGTVAPKAVKLWTAAISDWNSDAAWGDPIVISYSETAGQIFKVYKNKDSGYYYSAFCIFSTNSINPDYRKVYVRSGKYGAWYSGKSKNISSSELTTPVLYEVTPSGLNPVTTDSIAFDAALYSDGYKNNICSAAYFNGKINFFCSPAVVTNESSAKSEPDFVYYSNGSTLYYSKKPSTGDWPTYSGSIGASHNISALAVCADSILIGMGNTTVYSTSTSGGITHSYLNGGVPTGTTTFSTNATSQISSGYLVYALLNADPSQNELDSALYAAIGFCGSGSSNAVSYSSIGLWSYYKSRGNWNRE